MSEILKKAQNVIDIEIEAIQLMKEKLDTHFENAVSILKTAVDLERKMNLPCVFY